MTPQGLTCSVPTKSLLFPSAGSVLVRHHEPGMPTLQRLPGRAIRPLGSPRHLCVAASALFVSACVFLPPGSSVNGQAVATGEAPLVLSPAPSEGEALAETWEGSSREADLIHLVLDVVLDLESDRIVGKVTHTFRALRNGTQEIRLHQEDLEIREVRGAGGDALGYREIGGYLEITLEEPLAVGEEAQVAVEFSAQRGESFSSSLEQGGSFAPTAYGTSFPGGLRSWVPTWDQPGDLTTMDTRIQLRDDMSALANGVLVAVDAVPGEGLAQKVFSWRLVSEVPVRSLAIAAAQFDTFAAEADETELYFHLPSGTDPDTAQRTFGESTAVLEYLRRRLDRPFPFPRYDQAVLPDLPNLMLDGASVTLIDASELPSVADELDDRRERPRRSVARGAARKWFGAWIAPLQERHRWLLDGIALYLELDYEGRVRGIPEVSLEWDQLRDSIRRLSGERLAADDGNAGVVALARDKAAERAAWVMRILRTRLGEEDFWRVLRAFAAGEAGRVVTVEDFRRLCLRMTGQDIGPEIAQWTGRITVPELAIRFQRRTVEGVGESLGIVVEQTQPGPLFHVTLPVEVQFADGTTARESLVIDQQSNLLIVPLDDRVIDVAIDPEGTVLAGFEIEKDDASWIAQGNLSRSAIDRAQALPHLDRLASTNEEAREALIRILHQSPEPSLRERATQWLHNEGPAYNFALEQAAADDPSPLVRRAALHALLQRFAQGTFEPDIDSFERFLVLQQRELSPAVLEKLEQIMDTLPNGE